MKSEPKIRYKKQGAKNGAKYAALLGDGNEIYAPHTSVTVQLRTCDLTDEALPQIHEDLRKVAALRLSDIHTEPTALQCSCWDLPHL